MTLPRSAAKESESNMYTVKTLRAASSSLLSAETLFLCDDPAERWDHKSHKTLLKS